MVVRTIVKKGFDHPVYCEDDLFFSEYNGVYIGAIFDGCSTGLKSHFASSLYGKILAKTWKNNYNIGEKVSVSTLSYLIFSEFFEKFKTIVSTLDLNDLEVVSTMILCIIKDNQAKIIVSGDGCILVDGEEYKLESKDNAPDYLAYYLNNPLSSVFDHIREFDLTFEKDLSICSDGIYSFTDKDKNNKFEEVKNSLLLDKGLIKSEAMLARKYNLLLKQGYSNYDDLSIVRFINESI